MVTPKKAGTAKITVTTDNGPGCLLGADLEEHIFQGKITVNKKAKAGTKVKITVKTANGKSNYIYIVVK